jgi:hypothetical protein
MYRENELIEFGQTPFYSNLFTPYQPVGRERKMTPADAINILKNYEYTKGEKKTNIKLLKAKMTLQLPLTFGEILRLQKAQENANGYAHIRKTFNVIDLEKELI